MTDAQDDARDTDPDKLASELQHDADQMEERSEDLDQEIDRTAKDWESKRRDRDEAGAPPPESDE